MVVRKQLDHKKRADLTSLLIWRRKFTEFSIQDIHQINHLRGGKGPHNSQWHKLENDTIDPYLQLFKSLAAFFHELHTEKNFLYITSEKLRTRCKNAQPYLTHDGRVPNMIDLIEIFEGIQPVNSLYAKPEKITAIPKKPTNAECEKIGKLAAQHFKKIQREEVLGAKEAWKLFVDSEFSQMVKTEHLDSINDTLRGDQTLTFDIMKDVYLTYGRCPVVTAFRNISDLPISGEFARLVHDTELYIATIANKENKSFEMSVVEV